MNVKGTGEGGWRPKLDPTNRTGLSAQLADQLRAAIADGVYRAGDVLPSIRELASALKTSVKVPLSAYRLLTDEGLIRSRPRLGSVVCSKSDAIWRGHVLIVVPSGNYVYLNNMLVGDLRANLAAEGYLVSEVSSLRTHPDEPYDLRPLAYALRASLTFVVALQPPREVIRVLARCGVPYAAICLPRSCPAKGCVGTVRVDRLGVMDRFVLRCRQKRVRRVMVVGKPDEDILPVVRRLCAGGLKAEPFMIAVRTDLGRPEAVQRGALESFAAFLQKGRALPEAFLFCDDWICWGAMTALLEWGVRVPADVRVATLSNRGLGPVFSRPFERLEVDHAHYAAVVSQAILSYLGKRRFPKDSILSPRYVEGETF